MSYLPEENPYHPPRAPVGGVATSSGGADRPKAKRIKGSPWLTIWTKPRATIRTIVQADPTRGLLLLATLSGADNAFNRMLDNPNTQDFSDGMLLVIVFIGGPIGGVFSIHILGWLFDMTAGWLGGRGSTVETRAAVAWGTVPTAVNLAFAMLCFLALGRGFFNPAAKLHPSPMHHVYTAFNLIFTMWTLIASLKCIAEVQRISTLKALGAFALGVLVIAGCFLALWVMVVVFRAVLIST